jgi:16S rRNA (guanine527-N7)-methyltransferase
VQDILAAAAQAGVSLGEESAIRLDSYISLLMRWNTRLNLTAVRDRAQIVQRHIVECVFAANHIPGRVTTLLDFGSGAGLPGIPIAICRPEISVALAESQGKKAAFLREAVRTLGLGCEVFAGRVESMPAERRFDAVTLRAVDNMETACLRAAARVCAGGTLALLTTLADQARWRSELSDFAWNAPLALPSLESGILFIGFRSR